jgi:hypothetical protein
MNEKISEVDENIVEENSSKLYFLKKDENSNKNENELKEKENVIKGIEEIKENINKVEENISSKTHHK